MKGSKLQVLFVLAAGIWALGAGRAAAQGPSQNKEKLAVGTFGQWVITNKDDPLDGRSTFFFSPGKQPSTSLFISFKHTKPSLAGFTRMHQFSIHYTLGKDLGCPHIDQDVPAGQAPSRSVFVRWKIDDGPVHNQSYSLSCLAGRCNVLSYLWRVMSVEREGYIARYQKQPNPFPRGSRYYNDFENFYGLPTDHMVHILRKGKSIYFRASDRCESTDVEFNLRGLDEAMTASGIETFPPR